jgi:O-6-methylguanine DNA methyltransferase
MLTLSLSRIASPLGPLLCAVDCDGALVALEFGDLAQRMDRLLARQWGAVGKRQDAPPPPLAAALDAYWAKDFAPLAGYPVRHGGTAFQRAAWAALRAIPVGQTRSYGAQAASIGKPAAVRAIGLANGANPIGIATPCHRVIGAGGALTGYGGGVERKAWLLRHEGAL